MAMGMRKQGRLTLTWTRSAFLVVTFIRPKVRFGR